jgi:hypothetical protein
VGSIEETLHLPLPVTLLALMDEVAGVLEIFEDAVGLRPFAEQWLFLKKWLCPKAACATTSACSAIVLSSRQ